MSITKFCSILVTMDLLTQLNLEDSPLENDLYNMGWRGPMEGKVPSLMIIMLAASGLRNCRK